MLLVYTPKTTSRLRYAFKLILGDILGISFSITNKQDEFKAYQGPRLNYSNQVIADEVFIHSRNLLFETGVNEQPIHVTEWQGEKVFYSTVRNSALPFDPFAAAFYLVSRYEEYLPHIRDHYDRFNSKESVAYKNGFLQKPVINIWAQWLKKILLEKYSELKSNEKKYSFISSIDIDNAYAYREKGFLRTMGGFVRSLSKGDKKELGTRVRVLTGREQDPYDTYNYQLELQKKYNYKQIYFILLGDYGLNDKNIPHRNKNFQSLIKRLSDYADIGIHPSFGSNENPVQLKTEVERLALILNREITQSRQHFLKLRLPDTYRHLIDMDITDDYTMGYASDIGFRAGIAMPFMFYDLDMETETRLRIHPFAVMEGTLKYNMKVAAEEAMNYITPLIEQTKAVNGTFMSLWHNDTLNNSELWKGWKDVYEQMLEKAV